MGSRGHPELPAVGRPRSLGRRDELVPAGREVLRSSALGVPDGVCAPAPAELPVLRGVAHLTCICVYLQRLNRWGLHAGTAVGHLVCRNFRVKMVQVSFRTLFQHPSFLVSRL